MSPAYEYLMEKVGHHCALAPQTSGERKFSLKQNEIDAIECYVETRASPSGLSPYRPHPPCVGTIFNLAPSI